MAQQYLTKEAVKEVFEELAISFQEEATSRWNSNVERNCFKDALIQVYDKMEDLEL